MPAFFRGCVPPLWGSAVYRSVMMSAYEAAFTFFDQRYPEDSVWKSEWFGCVRPMVLASGVFTSLCRAVVEAPIEQAKVMRQTGRPWACRTLYRGAFDQALRTTVILSAIFVPYDVARRKTTLFDSLAGQFAVCTSACAFGYAVGWPFETLKNCAQAGVPSPAASLSARLAYLGGPLGLYRGAVPGILCGGLRNGCAMLAMNGIANPLVTRMGLRD